MSVCSFGSRADLDRLHEVPVPSWIQVGESVIVTSTRTSSKLTGVVQFVGNVEFAPGPWIGVDLDLPEGIHSKTSTLTLVLLNVDMHCLCNQCRSLGF